MWFEHGLKVLPAQLLICCPSDSTFMSGGEMFVEWQVLVSETAILQRQPSICRFSSRHFDPPPPQAPPIGVAATLLQHHHQCLDSMGGFCMRRYQHRYPWFTLLQGKEFRANEIIINMAAVR
ncbi:hypothetical protein EYF80_005629 [Liparis tanakae]|uniref:Uncharacterized protein n=1 Tax=Liparis tanakae TaxID=230148 RepID=A0A4Z2J4B1_9TELE|nr:hypothetical protein EYF80_005629 [Liparis tanakae]